MIVVAELSGAAAVAAVLVGRYCLRPGERVCVVVCGAGKDALVAAEPSARLLG
jgi:threonine dehydratase